MKKVLNKVILSLITLIIYFFIGLNNVDAKNITKSEYETIEDMYNKNLINDSFGIQDGKFFDMCFYKLTGSDNIFDRFLFGYVLISFNPSYTNTKNEKVGAYRISWNTYNHGYGQNAIYSYNYGRDSIILYDELKMSSDVNSPDGSSTGAYVRFTNKDIVTNLKKGICPSYADITKEGWKDDEDIKRICFTNEPNGCDPKEGENNAYDADGATSSPEKFYTCKYGKKKSEGNTIDCMSKYIDAAVKSMDSIDVSDKKYCDVNSDKFVDEVDKIISKLSDNIKIVAAGDRTEGGESLPFVSDLNLVKFSDGKMEEGSSIYTEAGVDKLVKKFNTKSNEVKENCVDSGLVTEDEWDDSVSETLVQVVEKINGGEVVGFGSALDSCTKIKGTNFYEDLQYIFTAIRIATPILVIVLVMKDMISAVTAGKEDEMKKAQKNTIIRLIVGVCIFLLPTIVNVIVSYIDELSSGSCGIG